MTGPITGGVRMCVLFADNIPGDLGRVFGRAFRTRFRRVIRRGIKFAGSQIDWITINRRTCPNAAVGCCEGQCTAALISSSAAVLLLCCCLACCFAVAVLLLCCCWVLLGAADAGRRNVFLVAGNGARLL